MAGTELGRPRAIDRVEPQRGKLAAALQVYELAVMNPEPGWSDGVGAPLGLLRDAFIEHVDFTEGPGGLFEEMLDEAAEVTSEIDHLRRDHIMVSVAMDRADEALASPPSDEDHFRELLASVAKLVSAHRRRGQQLLYEVYSVDTAAETERSRRTYRHNGSLSASRGTRLAPFARMRRSEGSPQVE